MSFYGNDEMVYNFFDVEYRNHGHRLTYPTRSLPLIFFIQRSNDSTPFEQFFTTLQSTCFSTYNSVYNHFFCNSVISPY